jgi:tetratricopeptide (TPR) repeat protein
MHPFLRSTTRLGVLLAMASGPLAAGSAHAADDDRRTLTAREMDREDPKTEYARQAAAKRMESINFLKDLLKGGDVTGDRKAEMMLRLADLYFQQGRYIYFQEMDAFDEEVQRCEQDESCDEVALFERGPENEGSEDWQNRSIRLYEQILNNYQRYARADEATFYLGMALLDTGRKADANRQFIKLTKQYPDSTYIADAYVNIGEYYFNETENAYKALLAYKKATGYPDSGKYSFALYKLAWCYYNVGEYGKAIDTMKSVVTYTQNQGNAQKAIQLQDEALKDLVRFFADAGEMNEAYAYFNKLGKKELIQDMLKRLASMYFEQGKFEQTIATYRRLISENPQSPDNPEYQTEIIKAYKQIGQKEETLQEIDRLLKTYGKQSAWARANATNQDAVKSAEDSIEKNLRQVAVEYHNEARKLGNHSSAKETYALAEEAYAVYLREFPNSSHAYEVRYAYGELLYKLKKYEGAYEQYMAVVQLDPKGKHSRFCAESAIFAAEELIKADGGAEMNRSTGKVGKDVEPQELSENEQKLIDACAQYAKLYPGDNKTKNAIYKSGYLLYNKYRFAEAADQFNLVIKQDPSSGEAEKAANLILDSFAIREDYANLKKNAKIYYEQEGLGSTSFKKDVYDIYQRASFQLIVENLEKDGDKVKAAKAFEDFYAEFEETAETEVLATAINNAAVYYANEGRVEDAMRLRHLLIEDEKFGDKTKYYYDAIEKLGFAYESIADFDQAAKYYEMMFGLFEDQREKVAKDDEEKAAKMVDVALDAIYSAAVFRKAMGETEQAEKDYRDFIATAMKYRPDVEETRTRVLDVYLTIGRMYEDAGQFDKAASEYAAFYNGTNKATKDAGMGFTYFARLRHGKVLMAQGKDREARKLYTDTVDMYEKFVAGGGEAGEYTEYVAEMMYVLAQPAVDEYMAMKIESRGGGGRRTEDRHMKSQLVAKQKKLQELDKTFKEIIATKSGPWSLASLVALGKIQENMSQTLLEGDTPYYLTEDQAEIYTMGMQDMAYPRSQAAIELYRLALDKAYELTLYNEDTAYATRRLGELAPDDFPGLEEEILKPRYTSAESRTYDFESEL